MLEQAVKAGFTVYFVIPRSGVITFNNLDMVDSKHRDYIYNYDFVYALEHTLCAASMDASNYVCTGYIFDQDAKRLKPGNLDIDRLYSEICVGEDICTK